MADREPQQTGQHASQVEIRQTDATVEDRLSAIRAQFDVAFTPGRVADDGPTAPRSIVEI
jgi:hypothetical protein